MKISDLKVMVTGAGSGMGRHFAQALAAAGAQVAALDVNEAALAETAGGSGGAPGAIRTYLADVTKEEQVAAAVQQAADDLGGVNALINNAGIFRDGLLVKVDKASGAVKKMTLDQWQSVIDVDLTGPFLMTRDVVTQMIERSIKPGLIVNISSVSRHGNAGQSNYSAAKAGLVADTKLWANELARYGIRVAAIAPGFIRTPILDAMRPEMLDKMVSGVPLRRVGEPEEIFAGIRFIVECDYFTGKCLDIDGGLVL